MKALTRNHFFNLKPLQSLWVNLLRAATRGSEFWYLDHSWHGMSMLVQPIRVHADRVRFAGLSALQALALSSTANYRIFAGLIFVGIVTPLASCTYQLFDFKERVEGWYHLNSFHLFMLLGPYLSGLALTIGVFLLFPKGVKRAYTLLIPAGYFVGKLIWLYQTSSNEEYWMVPSFSFFAVGAVISLTIFFCSIGFATDSFTVKIVTKVESKAYVKSLMIYLLTNGKP
jgi:hypothetical protein